MKIIDVVFENNPVIYSANISEENVLPKTMVIVRTQQGLQLVKTVSLPKEKIEKQEIQSEEEPKEIFDFVKMASQKEIQAHEENKKWGLQIKEETKKLIRKYNLEMKISQIQVVLDKSKVLIYFTSENRVDFRDLVKELASIYKTRIELKQIGSRDETRAMGGFGPCGKECCCKEFLNNFEHVSIKMAKNQNLSLNPSKINGLCGRLLCCLGYENEHYAETNKLMPKVGSEVITPNGKGKVIYNDLLKRIVQVKIGDETNFEIKNFDLNDIKR